MVNVTTSLQSLLPALQANAEAELIYWTEAELYRAAGSVLVDLARKAAVFVSLGTISVTAGTQAYSKPARHFRNIDVAFNDSCLNLATVEEIEALGYPSTPATPQRISDLDQTLLYLHPNPETNGSLHLIYRVIPVEPTSGGTVATIPAAMQDLAYFGMLAHARGRESKAAMPEVAVWANEMARLMTEAAAEYWGS